jgi:hypothetical protein
MDLQLSQRILKKQSIQQEFKIRYIFAYERCRHPFGYWKSVQNQRAFLNEISPKLNIKSLEDWYSKSFADVVAHGGRTMMGVYSSSISKMLTTVYPEYPRLNDLRLTASDLIGTFRNLDGNICGRV